jgi:serine/threonine-protein kinase
MGEVYRARDTKLKREVAIKVLPDAFAADAERLVRFQREAEVLATLNHPNIAQIYGFEERALVLELVEGPTLADRIAQGPVPLDEAIGIARQIAEALEAAHEQGIIHRDLKPANIKVRPDSTVKVLDFGLAKAMEPVSAPNADVTVSPTITSPAMTQMGIILGTAAYMSPEQAKGRQVDKRSDVWAFGAVLYEMLSGQRAFKGDDISDTLAAVLRQDVDWMALPASTSVPVRRLLVRCLDRDVRRRLRDIGEADRAGRSRRARNRRRGARARRRVLATPVATCDSRRAFRSRGRCARERGNGVLHALASAPHGHSIPVHARRRSAVQPGN